MIFAFLILHSLSSNYERLASHIWVSSMLDSKVDREALEDTVREIVKRMSPDDIPQASPSPTQIPTRQYGIVWAEYGRELSCNNQIAKKIVQSVSDEDDVAYDYAVSVSYDGRMEDYIAKGKLGMDDSHSVFKSVLELQDGIEMVIAVDPASSTATLAFGSLPDGADPCSITIRITYFILSNIPK